MFKDKRVLAIIPARGGSKRLPGKNIMKFCGKPLIAWAISQAKRSRHVDSVVVSTDDPGIARVAGRYGAEVPFTRPAKLSTDRARSADVLLHCVKWLEKTGRHFDIVVLLQATSPLRTETDIDGAIRLLSLKRATCIVSVCRAEHNPLWMLRLGKSGSVKKFLKTKDTAGRAARGAIYRLNGAVYVITAKELKRSKGFYGNRTYAYVMPASRSIDIDVKEDFTMAETLAKRSR